ncbi:MAG: sigma-54-dependent Fis family transcriptional regulator [Polyangiaceae bacterium]|nr:sigma-54-dependent Fis family transcriptional regulator [Polyangiaceae bacterium]
MLPERKQILVVDDEPNLRRVLGAQLMRDGYDVHTAEDGEQALQTLQDHHIDLVITDLRMPKVDGMELLRRSVAMDADLPVIMITAHATVDNAVEALKTGAFDYITKPFDQAEVRVVVGKALRTRDLSAYDARRSLEDSTPHVRYGIIGFSSGIRELYAVLDRVADTPTNVLITGESGTGKELVARALHENSSRAGRPFIKVNCAAIPRDLMESELFGYERGAFTGAVGSKPGRFELASGGTLLLDEIGSIPVEMQVKLLRALQESEFERVGGIKTIRVDVRLIAATNSDLKKDIETGSFREDLFYRLNVVPIRLPSLRERAEDIPPLARHFIERSNARLSKHIQSIVPEAEQLLVKHPWPGNIRELENVIERAVLFCDDDVLRPTDLPPELRPGEGAFATGEEGATASGGTSSPAEGLKEQVKAAMSRLERDLIIKALRQTRGNVTHAARLLKISRKGLQLKMKELNLRERDERFDS